MLEHGKNIVYESAAINQYIDETWTARPLMASAPYERAMERVATHWANTTLAKEMYHVIFGIRTTVPAPEVKLLMAHFDELEKRLVRACARRGHVRPYPRLCVRACARALFVTQVALSNHPNINVGGKKGPFFMGGERFGFADVM